LEAASGLEPLPEGFASLPLSHLGTPPPSINRRNLPAMGRELTKSILMVSRRASGTSRFVKMAKLSAKFYNFQTWD
jgi:hypothetical protein